MKRLKGAPRKHQSGQKRGRAGGEKNEGATHSVPLQVSARQFNTAAINTPSENLPFRR
jgi:hypothetical protein